MSKSLTRSLIALAVVVLALAAAACGAPAQPGATQQAAALTATPRSVGRGSKIVAIDGSSTVFPITEAVAEEFQKKNKDARVTIGVSGTGGGFKKFCNKETDIQNASRPITQAEKDECARNGVQWTELPVAYDALSLVVNPANTFAQCLTTAELKAIWAPDSKITNWKDVRSGFPDQPLKLYGPGTDSGTFDYFTEVINGKAKASRSDYQASEDDNILVQGVSGDRGGLGYFGYAYARENEGKVKAISVDGGKGCVAPSTTTVENGTYAPLSRPLFIYVSHTALARPEIREFANFYLTQARTLVDEVGYDPLPQAQYDEGLKKVADVK